MSGVDLNAKNVISQTAETGKVVFYSTPNIDVIGIKLSKQQLATPKDISLLNTEGGVIIPGGVTNDIRQVTVVKYSSIKDILSNKELKESVDNTIKLALVVIRSTIVSLTTEPPLNATVAEPLKIVIQNNQTGYVNPKRICAFTEPNNRRSNWSSSGCTLNEAESGEENVTCDCDHNTAFAIMMDVADVEVTESERKILETISTVGCSISLLGVTLTILMQGFYWKKVKSQRAKILISMCVAIGFTDVFAILEGVARDNLSFCKAVAALLHFFVLSAFGWMLCEGILLYVLVISVFDKGRSRNWKIFNFIGWGIPLLIVAVSLGATQGDGYGTETSCWLSVENKVIWAFVGPAFIVILINTIVFVMVMRKMMRTRKLKTKSNIEKVKAGVKASAVIFPVLGLTWIFGLLTFNRETLFFRYLFAVFNSAQGLLIFLFHCVFNNQMRDIVRTSTKKSTLSSRSISRSRNNKATRSTDNPTVVSAFTFSSRSTRITFLSGSPVLPVGNPEAQLGVEERFGNPEFKLGEAIPFGEPEDIPVNCSSALSGSLDSLNELLTLSTNLGSRVRKSGDKLSALQH
ncbi:adhesion G-protein coupled receptor D1-like [Dendronephthya gigantea]|uniref:adhesion G-protein coupled receptor D1-like n=1 Tax=Dendronephthya gigantea TaxID=151771 RepID=UPI00106C4E46|nr:adhesion G-protein coupled receptor D1-like [Dendronephthya gigantea]